MRKVNRRAGTTIGRGLAGAGRWIGRTSWDVGRSIASAYHAIDPDVRRHVAQMPLVAVSYLAARERAIERLPDDGRPPVLFVHGLGGHRGNFLGLAAWLRLAGRRRCYALGLPPDATVEAMAARVRSAIRDVARVNGLRRRRAIDVVAHSMGGIVARVALGDAAVRAKVRTLVTLGTPHGGTFAARYGATRHLIELRPGSKTLRALDRQVPWRGPPAQPRLVCLWSASDVMLLPATSACVEGAENVEMPGFTHYSYLIHPRGARAVARALDAERPT